MDIEIKISDDGFQAEYQLTNILSMSRALDIGTKEICDTEKRVCFQISKKGHSNMESHSRSYM